ncbi:hypothetical protein [Thiohalocapsa sp. ML1]|jgi:hypothetical protein|uniref:hypothetical protein n=1 Tax=Thiohalocapsa sp. ML1 TaxID=1431688 RepID=UPI0012E399B3|nr:hypothetical protein [Thiohalocapsa sp. ML1]
MSVNDTNLEGITQYCNLLEELKLRVKAVQDIVNGKVSIAAFGHPYFADDFVFLQIRKILEIVAFGSMCSNIELYRTTYDKYAAHWSAKDILKKLERINKHFYPLPLKSSNERPVGDPPELKHAHVFENVRSGFLTKDEFGFLYDCCSRVIHSPNPYKEAQKIDLRMSVDDWMHRIASLLWFHRMKLAHTDVVWFVYLMHPEHGRTHAVLSTSLKR